MVPRLLKEDFANRHDIKTGRDRKGSKRTKISRKMT